LKFTAVESERAVTGKIYFVMFFRNASGGRRERMNLINDLGSELAYAVLIEKRNSERIHSEDILPLVNRLNDALEAISRAQEAKDIPPVPTKNVKTFSH
jgi:hypothetical protein